MALPFTVEFVMASGKYMTMEKVRQIEERKDAVRKEAHKAQVEVLRRQAQQQQQQQTQG
jgi:hypothetical protein